MPRKRNEITGEQLQNLLDRLVEIKEEVEEANAAIDNHIPVAQIWEGYQSTCLFFGMELSKLTMRLQTIERCWDREKQLADIEARRVKA